ncbi:acetyl/propionyl/methylcrotonyl-CoA carboxylase subunit alpha [Pokkaliibacter plantistimulans]
MSQSTANRMISKLLIANRGEIACRVMRTAQDLGIRTVAVYSSADANATHVKMADEAFHIGDAPSKDSYLRGDVILAVARRAGADAIHPGYGFLSENASFARACHDAGIIFVGPPAEAIEAMGSKSAAKAIMEEAGVPLVPGYHGTDQDAALLKTEASRIGYPVLLKAVAGGGGKGMRVVWQANEFEEALQAARREGQNAFGNSDMLVEKYLTRPRHVEIQVFADQLGHTLYLAERDCSIQRRHQKVIEEAPAPGMTAELRQAMGQAAVRAAEAIGYVGAGTVEFLLDEDGSFYFMEMNTRLQVEHPVTEMITGLDLVEWQLLAATGHPLPLCQEQVQINGHAIEVRVYAEDPDHDFLPATGHIHYLRTPPTDAHVRVDTGVGQGDDISIYYDPMIAKLIVWDSSRERAINRLNKALAAYQISGVKTNLNFLSRLSGHPAFAAAELDTGFIERHRDTLFAAHNTDQQTTLAAAAMVVLLDQQQQRHDDPWQQSPAWRLNAPARQQLRLLLDEQEFQVSATRRGQGYQLLLNDSELDVSAHIDNAAGEEEESQLVLILDSHRQRWQFHRQQKDEGTALTLFNGHKGTTVTLLPPVQAAISTHHHDASLSAPMNGTVVAVLVSPGEQVETGTGLIVVEAMKMEHTLRAPQQGVVDEIYFQAGDRVNEGDELLAFTPLDNQG